MEYYDLRKRADKLRTINLIIGGRGIGKTYSALRFMIEKREPFIYLRNTDTQLRECSTVFGNPFKRINIDFGYDIRMIAEGKHYLIKDFGADPEAGELIGYGAALSTFRNLRGVDLSDCVYAVYDEFIERDTLRFKQFDAFAGFYETVNRNRELAGRPPFCCILLSNSQTLNNDILLSYGVTERIIKMIEDGQRAWSNEYMRIELPVSEVSEAKRETAHYKLIAGTKAAAEALNNEFAYDSFKNIKKQNIKEFLPVCLFKADNGFPVTFWRHKSLQKYYATSIPDWNCPTYDEQMYPLFLRECGLTLREAVIRSLMFYESYECKAAADMILKC